MNIIAREDIEQYNKPGQKGLALCPVCGQKLFEVVSLHVRGVFRIKCRRCKKYIKVSALSDKE